ncbi:5'-AMP-activated protein kinase-like protein isoform X2 [Wolffia australiana]
MAVCRLPTPPSFPSKTRPLPHIGWAFRQTPSNRTLLLVCAAKDLRTGRKSRASKSNAELCDELREFVLVSGFPEHHVPSTKELLDHGRKDLAYIVRRRGHKGIAKLLANPPNGDISPDEDSHSGEFTSKASAEESIGQNAQDPQSHTAGAPSFEVVAGVDDHGVLESTKDTREGVSVLIHSDNEIPSETKSVIQEIPYVNDEGADYQVSVPYLNERSSVRSGLLYSKTEVPSEIPDVDSNGNSSSDLVDAGGLDQAKVDHLRELLREKEAELALLKRQLEEEKLALFAMQGKFESELNKVQDTISCKDQELQEAEESLSGLKEVLLEYRGYAETVEVTGSFNGWQHKLSLDRQTPSKTVDFAGTREATVWSTVLWLYPGVYEIKFIADGNWVIDPQREFISRDSIVNNILRVNEDGEPSHRQTD